MKKILTQEDKSWRPQLGTELKEYLISSMLPKTNTENLSGDWNVTDMARYVMAHGVVALTKKPIPDSVREMFKRFEKDLDL